MSETNSNCYIFAGPSFGGCDQLVSAARQNAELLPPVQRCDVERMVDSHSPGTMVLVDGYFQQCLSVGHAEIRDAVAAGWTVWGLSSLGAIRAYEMRNLGVRGYGRVYQRFLQEEDFRDDEVALIHEPEPPYRSFSEPLIHIRLFLQHLLELDLITRAQEERLLTTLMAMWFGDRTLGWLRANLIGLVPQNAAAIEIIMADFQLFRVKFHDLKDFINEEPWKAKENGETGGAEVERINSQKPLRAAR